MPVKRKRRNRKKKVAVNPLEPPFPLSSDPPNFGEAFANIAKILEGRKKILVLAGAGISVACGIPDFRSKNVGLYSTLDYQVRVEGRLVLRSVSNLTPHSHRALG